MSLQAEPDQFRQTFREEAREILADLERTLLELNDCPQDMELVGRAFRLLHTIKGSGAMFGFDELAAFTHNLENAFDAVRSGDLSVTADLVDLTLSSIDHVQALLGDVATGDSEGRENLLERLRAMTMGAPALLPAISASPDAKQPGVTPSNETRSWSIHFAPGETLMRRGSDPVQLIRELATLGQLEATCSTTSLPTLTEIDPERCYITWSCVLRTQTSLDAIRDVFIFVEDCCELSIEPLKDVFVVESDLTARALSEKRADNGGRRQYDLPDNATSIRVAAAKLDQFVNLVGELVTVQARLGELAAQRDDPEVCAVAEEVDRLASALRETSMSVRMMSIRGTFEKFRRLVHDLARDLGKDVELTIEGAETELDKTVIDQLSDPLMHLIRNSMDHGIGSPSDRAAAGKPARGMIHLSARYSGASVLITVSDDGRGIARDAVRARAIERGLITQDAHLDESELNALIFQPGFSTAAQVTDLSGRGVGLDVVRRNIDRLRGSIDVASRPGKGTAVTLRLPLTLAIIDGLLVTVGDARFILPLATTLECIEMSRRQIDDANGQRLITVRGEVLPYIRLREYFDVSTPLPSYEQVMLVETDEGRYGLVFDRVLGSCQTMIKSLGRVFRNVQGVSGATILGNGSVALILDPQRLVLECIRAIRPRGHPHTRYEKAANIQDSAQVCAI